MSWCNRRIFLLSAAALTGCGGFDPVYTQTQVSQWVGNIAFDTPSSRDTYALRNQLERRLGNSKTPQFGLSYSTTKTTNRAAVSFDGQAYRQQILGTATYALRDLATNQVIHSGQVKAFVGYAPTGSTTSAQAAERDASARLMIQLADRIIDDLMFAQKSASQ